MRASDPRLHAVFALHCMSRSEKVSTVSEVFADLALACPVDAAVYRTVCAELELAL